MYLYSIKFPGYLILRLVVSLGPFPNLFIGENIHECF
jgi:hypothetical protein